jgi:tRNA pseudouridine32 synthase/23S rRNA pseudouridine746 synthase
MLDVIHIHPDRSFIAVNKPAGLLSTPGRGADTDPTKADCVVQRVRTMFPHAAGPMVVHRLDMETSGVMLVALTADRQRELSTLFERRAVAKQYVALLAPPLELDDHEARRRLSQMRTQRRGRITAPIRLDPDDRPRQVVDPYQGKPSETHWRALQDADAPPTFADDAARSPDAVRVLFTPITGRSHQLRVHAALDPSHGGLGLPIIGDSLYARSVGHADDTGAVNAAPRPQRNPAAGAMLRLHACSIDIDALDLRVNAPMPPADQSGSSHD